MTRQEIIDSLQTCRNAKCYDCLFDNKPYPVCVFDLIEGLSPHIIHELQQVDKAIEYMEDLADRNPNSIWIKMLKDNIETLLKGDDSHANSSE